MLTNIHILPVGIREVLRFWYISSSINVNLEIPVTVISHVLISAFSIFYLTIKPKNRVQCYILRDKSDSFRRVKINITYVMAVNLCIYESKVLNDYRLIFL